MQGPTDALTIACVRLAFRVHVGCPPVRQALRMPAAGPRSARSVSAPPIRLRSQAAGSIRRQDWLGRSVRRDSQGLVAEVPWTSRLAGVGNQQVFGQRASLLSRM